MRAKVRNLISLILVSSVFILIGIIYLSNNAKSSFNVEEVVFKTNVVPETTNDKSIDIRSKLYIPENKSKPVSAIIISPSSGGVEKEREIYYAEKLVQKGFAVLIIDSFSSRNLTNSLYDQSVLETWQMENDAFAGLVYLSKDKRINANKIAIMGVSKGGSVAMDTAHTIVREWADMKKTEFAAHIAIAPDCNWTTRSDDTTGKPIFFMLAELDDQTSVEACLKKAKRLRKAGNDEIKVTVYKGAQHAWEELGDKPVYDSEVENFASCAVWVEDDGQMTAANTEENIPENEWYEWANKNCKKTGAHCCGGTKEIKEKATRDIITFLHWYDF